MGIKDKYAYPRRFIPTQTGLMDSLSQDEPSPSPVFLQPAFLKDLRVHGINQSDPSRALITARNAYITANQKHTFKKTL